MTRRIAVLGSTGSIGRQTLDVIERCPDRFTVASLAARSDVDTVCEQATRFGVKRVAMVSPDAAAAVGARLPGVEVLAGAEGLVALSQDDEVDVVLNAVVGAAGLRSTLAALDNGRVVALANKESCVAGGPLVSRRLTAGRGSIVPVDSEHASTHMCLSGESMEGVTRLLLTASGGPFRGRTREELDGVTVSDALAHPTWSMGPKITIDSATLMNKGLEVIEAHVLFGLDFDQVDVVCHPQSVIHCLVEFADGSTKASMSPPDMRVPIAYALGWPARPPWGAEPVDWTRMRDLTFEPLDLDTFRSVRLAYEAGRAGGCAPAVLNAANEVAVEAFLDGRLPFLGIAQAVEEVLDRLGSVGEPSEVEDVLEADSAARSCARLVIEG